MEESFESSLVHRKVKEIFHRIAFPWFNFIGKQARGKAVIHSEPTNRKLMEIKKIREGNEGEQMVIDTKAEHAGSEHKDMRVHEVRDGSTMGCLHSIGSDLTRTRELPELQQNLSMHSGQEALGADKGPSRTPTSVREVKEPILQHVKHLKPKCQALQNALPMDEIKIPKLQADAIHSESTTRKLLGIKSLLRSNEDKQMEDGVLVQKIKRSLTGIDWEESTRNKRLKTTKDQDVQEGGELDF
ncbi:hypothetical protein U9M48_014839 [Paspalum notatum var. saurae]|uniref:Uncharacterized protein n=1 Tax=Paspalum notatum var. saurae TaxID=547442 RepID=A0AAQ3WKW7_PASNO